MTQEQKPADLTALVEQLKQLTAAVQEQNQLIKSCILQPGDNPPRFMVGMYGALEVISF